MSELKATSSGEIRARDALLGYWWYEKFEADKFIADLEESHKKEVGQLLILNREQANAANRLRDSMEQAIRHNKYKRCLAIADSCQYKIKYWSMRYTTAAGYDRSYEKRKHKLLAKWRKRWLDIAEKFKEAYR